MHKDKTSLWHQRTPDKTALPRGIAPADATLIGAGTVPLRVFLRYSGWEAMRELFEKEREHVGVLLGQVYGDDEGPFIVVEHALPAPHTRQTPGGITLSEDSWDALERMGQSVHPGGLVVGSFRIRPGGGTTLSPYDRFSAERFFPAWHQLLYVVDPRRQRQGMFHWRQGQLQALPGFWVFNEEAAVAADGVTAMAPGTVPSFAAHEPPSEALDAPTGPTARRRSPSLFALLLLLMLLLPWACVGALPGSLPAMRRQIDGAADTQQQLAAEVHSLQMENEQLIQMLDGLEQDLRDAPALDNGTVAVSDSSSTMLEPTVMTETTGPTEPLTPPSSAATGSPTQGESFQGLPAVPVVGMEGRYVIRQGDTLWGISHRLFGDPYAYVELAEDNDIPDPDLILPGWELRLPPEP